jgi:tRNA A-37 threonylcarbamoyl transferase component Bud32
VHSSCTMSSKYGGSSRAQSLLRSRRRDESNHTATPFSLGNTLSEAFLQSSNTNNSLTQPLQQQKTNNNSNNNSNNTATNVGNQPMPHKLKRRPSPKRKRESDPVHGLQNQFRSWDLATGFRRNVLGSSTGGTPDLQVHGSGIVRTPPDSTSNRSSPNSASSMDTVTPTSNSPDSPPQTLFKHGRRFGGRSDMGFSARASHTIKDSSRRSSSSSRRKRRSKKDKPVVASHSIVIDTPSKHFDPRHSVPPRSSSRRRFAHLSRSPDSGSITSTSVPTKFTPTSSNHTTSSSNYNNTTNAITSPSSSPPAFFLTMETPSPQQGGRRIPNTTAPNEYGHKVDDSHFHNVTPIARLTQSHGPTTRSLPVPNQKAFLENSDLTMSHHSDDPTPNKKQCPPTPQRTPNWLAHSNRRDDEDDDMLLMGGGDSMDGMLHESRYRPNVDDDPLCLSELNNDDEVDGRRRRENNGDRDDDDSEGGGGGSSSSSGGRRRNSRRSEMDYGSKIGEKVNFDTDEDVNVDDDEDLLPSSTGRRRRKSAPNNYGNDYGYFDDPDEEDEEIGGRSYRSRSSGDLARHFDFSHAGEDDDVSGGGSTSNSNNNRNDNRNDNNKTPGKTPGGRTRTFTETNNSGIGLLGKLNSTARTTTSTSTAAKTIFGGNGGRAAGLRAGSVTTHDDDDQRDARLNWHPPSRHRVFRTNSLEGNKVLINLNRGAGGKVDGSVPATFDEAFENHGILGSGAFSDVFKAKDRQNGMFYAVKRSKKRFKNKTERDRYLQEPRMYKKLTPSGMTKCQNVLEYYRAWQEEGYFYTQTELCSGGNLKNLLEQLEDPTPALPESTVWYVIRQVATGLNRMHTLGLVHMDIKPENILITETGKIEQECFVVVFFVCLFLFYYGLSFFLTPYYFCCCCCYFLRKRCIEIR